MAVKIKTAEEVELLAEGGKRLRTLLEELAATAAVGVTGMDLENKARTIIEKMDAKPSFLGYKDYTAALCISVNAAVVHGIPNTQPFQEGDLVSIDAGIIYKGLYTDSALTIGIGSISAEAERLLFVTNHSLELGIEAAQMGNRTGDIGYAIQTYVEGEKLGVVRQLVGHGVGYGVHEEPPVPNYGQANHGYKLKENLVIAIEPMVTIGDPTVITAEDGWTVVTKDGSLSAHFEHTVAITPNGPRILT